MILNNMNEKELYNLAISDVPKYSLLNEILAIRDNRFPNEQVDYCINVNGYISLDVLNKYVDSIKLIDELEKWLIEKLEECNTYSKYIEKKVAELQPRSSGKTYIASEIMKNEVAKKNWQEVLNKINELKDSDIK